MTIVFELSIVIPRQKIPQHSNTIAQTNMKIAMVNEYFQ